MKLPNFGPTIFGESSLAPMGGIKKSPLFGGLNFKVVHYELFDMVEILPFTLWD